LDIPSRRLSASKIYGFLLLCASFFKKIAFWVTLGVIFGKRKLVLETVSSFIFSAIQTKADSFKVKKVEESQISQSKQPYQQNYSLYNCVQKLHFHFSQYFSTRGFHTTLSLSLLPTSSRLLLRLMFSQLGLSDLRRVITSLSIYSLILAFVWLNDSMLSVSLYCLNINILENEKKSEKVNAGCWIGISEYKLTQTIKFHNI